MKRKRFPDTPRFCSAFADGEGENAGGRSFPASGGVIEEGDASNVAKHLYKSMNAAKEHLDVFQSACDVIQNQLRVTMSTLTCVVCQRQFQSTNELLTTATVGIQKLRLAQHRYKNSRARRVVRICSLALHRLSPPTTDDGNGSRATTDVQEEAQNAAAANAKPQTSLGAASPRGRRRSGSLRQRVATPISSPALDEESGGGGGGPLKLQRTSLRSKKRGFVLCLRQQKCKSLSDRRCVACSRELSHLDQTSKLLSNIDKAVQLSTSRW